MPPYSSLRPVQEQCEYRHNPLGIDDPKPRLSWKLLPADPKSRGHKQVAYQIVVASQPHLLSEQDADLWNTGKVASARTSQIVYEGKKLVSHQECYWMLRIWDEKGRMSKWGDPALWTMGVLSQDEWEGKWICEPDDLQFRGCRWIWTQEEGDPRKDAPAGKRYFWRILDIPRKELASAVLLLASDCFTAVYLDGRQIVESSARKGGHRSPQAIDLAKHLKTGGKALLAIEADHDGRGPAAVTGKTVLRFADGLQHISRLDSGWRSAKKSPKNWPAVPPALRGEAPREVAQVGECNSFRQPVTPWSIPGTDAEMILPPVPAFRKRFSIDGTVTRACLYVTALGAANPKLNGETVADNYLAPGWSDYNKRVYYHTYDVTDLLQPGDNVIGAELADGWYAGFVAWGRRRNVYGGDACLRMMLRIEYLDKRVETIATDESWQVGHSEVLEADMLMGETHDLREHVEWDNPESIAEKWPHANYSPVSIQMEAYPGEPVRDVEQIRPVSVKEQAPGVYIFDMGQNMVGFASIRVIGKRGKRITLRFAEVLNPDGSLYTDNLRCARAIDSVIPALDGIVHWEPRFTFHGFRYVELTGCAEPPDEGAIIGVVLQSDLEQTGHFECSNALVNKLAENILWGMKGNYLEVPTDCPQRDERLGWTGDAQAFIGTATQWMNVAPFFKKWLVDLEDSQRPDGAYTDVAPDIGLGAGSAGWADAGIICPWRIYQVYGDKRILERHYASMKRYMTYLEELSDGYIRPDAGFGDWLSLNAYSPRDLIGTAFFANSAHLMTQIAEVLGKKSDSRKYAKLRESIIAAFQKKYMMGRGVESWLQDHGLLQGNTQTVNVLALAFQLIPDEAKPMTVYHLVRDLQIRGYHLSTGFLGLPMLLPTLTAIGRLDLAYRLLLNERFPSWLYAVKHGATTIWERWDGWSEEFGFQNPEMNSYNHYAYGAVGQWLFETVAGIELSGCIDGRITIAPHPGGDLTHARAHVESIHGPVSSEWRILNGKLTLTCRIPANSVAEVRIPCEEGASIRESNKPVKSAKGVKFLGYWDNCAILEVTSGLYTFTLPA